MKSRRVPLILFLLLLPMGALVWALWPGAIDATAPAPKVASVKTMPEAKPELKVVPPKPVNIPVSAAASGLAPHSPPAATTTDLARRQAVRDARRQFMEKLLQSQTEALIRAINDATDDTERELITRQLTSLRSQMLAQIDLLSQPVLPPVDLGVVALAQDMPVKQPLDDGGTVTLSLQGSPNGEWQISVMVWHNYADGGSGSRATVPAISGQPTTVNVQEYEINFTPQVPAGPAPTTSLPPGLPPPPAASN